MVLFNYATKEITIKVVYYGPGLCGKTTNLQYIHSRLNPKTRGRLISLATETDRTLFFDFLPMEMGTIKGFKIRFQLYTVPGQVRYNATRKLVLKGADGIVFVADSQRTLMDQNIESLENLKENLRLNGLDPNEIPFVLQFNKRDLKDISPVSELNERLNYRGVPFFESIAIRGDGVLETFKEITKILLKKMSEKHRVEVGEEILPAEVAVKPEIPSGEEVGIHKPRIEDLHPSVELEGEMAGELTAPEGLEEEVIEASEYLPQEEAVAIGEEVSEGAEFPVELETPSIEEISVKGSEVPTEEAVEEKPLEYAASISELSDLLKKIMEGLDSLNKSLSGIKEEFTVHGSRLTAFLESLSEIKKIQEGLYRRILEGEEAGRKKTEEILKSLNEIKGRIETLREKPEKRWFGLR